MHLVCGPHRLAQARRALRRSSEGGKSDEKDRERRLGEPAFEPKEEQGEDPQGEQRGRHEAADDHRREGLLNFGTRRGREGHGNESQGRHRSGHQHGPQAVGASADYGFAPRQALRTEVPHAASQNDSVEHHHAEQGDESDSGRNAEGHSAQRQKGHAAHRRKGNGREDHRGVGRTAESEVEEHENQDQGHRNRDLKAGDRRAQVFKIAADVQPVAGRELDGGGKLGFDVGHHTRHVAFAHVDAHRNPSAGLRTADLRRSHRFDALGHGGQGDQVAVDAAQHDRAGRGVASAARIQAHGDVKALLSFVDGAGDSARKPVLNGLAHLVQRDAVVGHGLAVGYPAVKAHALGGLHLDVGGARNPFDGRRHSTRQRGQGVEVVSVQLQGDVALGSADELVESQLNGLGELKKGAPNVGEFGLH